ncbi:MAG TPA: hypothetical protein PLG20_06170 [Candidatus Syntrophosphaera sp.]|nr:hypothetical protein [Candidatus Syntrophosphaera sp.]
MADKTQSEQPATKADIQAVKADVQTVKTDVRAVKDDVQAVNNNVERLSETVTRLAQNLAKTDLRIAQSEDAILNTLRNFKSDILSAIDKNTAEAESYRKRDILRGNEIMGHTTKLKNHEDRLTGLEAK